MGLPRQGESIERRGCVQRPLEPQETARADRLDPVRECPLTMFRGVAGEINQPPPVFAGHGLLWPGLPPPQSSQCFPADGRRHSRQRGRLQADVFRRCFQDCGAEDRIGGGVLFADKFTALASESAKSGVDLGIKVAPQERQQSAANAVAGEAGVGISGVGPPGLPARDQPGLDFGSADVEQGAEDVDPRGKRGDWGDAGQSPQPGAAQQAVQHGLRLIVRSMPQSDPAGPRLTGDVGQHDAPQMPRGSLAPPCRRPGIGSFPEDAGDVELTAECGNPLGICL